MSFGDVLGIGLGLLGSGSESDAAAAAGDFQSQAALQGVEEQRRQFDKLQELFKPYVEAGAGALGQQQALLGLSGQNAQQQAISGFESSPLFQSLTQQGENAILQNASATGGLRGGNTQAALSQFRPQLLNQLIEQQYGRLGGLSSLGQSSAAGVGNAGINSASNIANLYGEQGAALAGSALAQGKADRSGYGAFGQLAGKALGQTSYADKNVFSTIGGLF